MRDTTTNKLKLQPGFIGATLISLLAYTYLAYFFERTQFILLLGIYGLLVLFYFYFLRKVRFQFSHLFIIGILFRLAFMASIPSLSQDFNRFIWDGQLIQQGINPYSFTPNELMANAEVILPNQDYLHQAMGSLSAMHYSNYPPLNQFFFFLSSLLGNGSIMASVIILRLFSILADIGVVLLGKRILEKMGKPPSLIFWYFLNPLILMELTGNLHFEGVMIFFFILSVYWLTCKKPIWAGVAFAASIMIKLVPLMFLPLLLPYLKFKKSLIFYLATGFGCLLFALPFYEASIIGNFNRSVGLWFSNFEFNAGPYNAIKYIAVNFYGAKPWELIKTYGFWIKVLTISTVLALMLFKKIKTTAQWLEACLLALTVYFMLSSTVHPWYISFLLILTIFSRFQYAILWSVVVILSYFAYSNPGFTENMGLLAIEYSLVLLFLFYELFNKNQRLLLNREK